MSKWFYIALLVLFIIGALAPGIFQSTLEYQEVKSLLDPPEIHQSAHRGWKHVCLGGVRYWVSSHRLAPVFDHKSRVVLCYPEDY